MPVRRVKFNDLIGPEQDHIQYIEEMCTMQEDKRKSAICWIHAYPLDDCSNARRISHSVVVIENVRIILTPSSSCSATSTFVGAVDVSRV